MHSGFLLCCQAILLLSTSAILLPRPNGPFGVSINSVELIDHSRPNPWADYPPSRKVMVSVFRPMLETCVNKSVPYMPDLVAEYYDKTYSAYGVPNGTFASISLHSCQQPHHNAKTTGHQSPMILFSPGLEDSRTIYSALASNIASHGYDVVTIDHPYDAPVVVFPDGSVVTAANISTERQILKALLVRTEDVAFVYREIDHALKLVLQDDSPSRPRSVFVAGHSLGGATAANAMLQLSSLHIGANLDGTFFGELTHNTTKLNKPLLLFSHENKSDLTWTSLWPRLTGAKADMQLLGSQHASFTDLPYLVDVLGFGDKLSKEAHQLLGSISGQNAFQGITEVLTSWFDPTTGPHGDTLVRAIRQTAKENSHLSLLRSKEPLRH